MVLSFGILGRLCQCLAWAVHSLTVCIKHLTAGSPPLSVRCKENNDYDGLGR